MSNSNQKANSECESRLMILVPTSFEFEIVKESLASFQNTVIEVCGFGPVIPAAKTVELINKHQPKSVLLLGIAGSYGDHLEIGDAYSFSKVGCYGVGVGTGESFQTCGQMGWKHLADSKVTIGDSISFGSFGQELLTVCAAAENKTDVKLRLQIFPNAVAEDMEGFAVAAACELCQTPLHIVRGISNRAGDRDKQNWQIKPALAAAVSLAKKVVKVNA